MDTARLRRLTQTSEPKLNEIRTASADEGAGDDVLGALDSVRDHEPGPWRARRRRRRADGGQGQSATAITRGRRSMTPPATVGANTPAAIRTVSAIDAVTGPWSGPDAAASVSSEGWPAGPVE
jgi:hypothetical protein